MREHFECEVVVEGVGPQVVQDAYWRLERWPEIAPHVVAIDIVYGDENAQVLIMTVQTRGQIDSFKSIRALDGNVIRYLQPRPPRMLRHHHGSWVFEAILTGTRVVSSHVIEIDIDAARDVLRQMNKPAETQQEITAAICSLVRGNSLQTMNALRERLEHGGAHVAALG
jgi:hypothetical protein